MTSTRLWRPAVLVKTRVWGMRAQSRGLIKPGLGHSYLRISQQYGISLGSEEV